MNKLNSLSTETISKNDTFERDCPETQENEVSPFAVLVDEIEKKAASEIPIEQGDYYGEDGLLVCGKCNTKKQCRNELFGRMRTHMCLCKCGAEARNKKMEAIERAELEKKYHEYRSQYARNDHDLFDWINNRNYKISIVLTAERQTLLQRICIPDKKMQGFTFDADDGTNEKVSAIMRNYTNNFDTMRQTGKGLLLFGTVGTGKTFAAVCVANALIDKGIPALVTNFATIADELQKRFDDKQSYYKSLNRFSLLVIDDLSAERKTEYMQEIVYNVIENRCRAGLPLIVTTNLTAEQLKNPADITYQRTFSRLYEMCIPVEVSGQDRRRDCLREDYKEYKDLLGII